MKKKLQDNIKYNKMVWVKGIAIKTQWTNISSIFFGKMYYDRIKHETIHFNLHLHLTWLTSPSCFRWSRFSGTPACISPNRHLTRPGIWLPDVTRAEMCVWRVFEMFLVSCRRVRKGCVQYCTVSFSITGITLKCPVKTLNYSSLGVVTVNGHLQYNHLTLSQYLRSSYFSAFAFRSLKI